jgi:hypothetical protein
LGGTWISESFFKYLKSQITKKNLGENYENEENEQM